MVTPIGLFHPLNGALVSGPAFLSESCHSSTFSDLLKVSFQHLIAVKALGFTEVRKLQKGQEGTRINRVGQSDFMRLFSFELDIIKSVTHCNTGHICGVDDFIGSSKQSAQASRQYNTECLSPLQAAAAMCVGVGSFSDPMEAQGLAHFLGQWCTQQ
jgi:hypothetical protein